MRSIVKGAMLAACAAVFTSALVIPASADPTFPSPTDIATVGSARLQYLCDDPTALTGLDCWYATGPSPIVTKPGCAPITRPGGSQAGIDALKADIGGCVDIARSERPPKPANTVPPGYDGDQTAAGPLLFIPVAEDMLRYALSAQVPSNGVDGLTAAQLRDIYTCVITDWHTLNPSVPVGTTIQPMIPQSGSETRSFFLSQIQLSAPNAACVTEVLGDDPTPIQNNPNALAPFFTAQTVYPTNMTGKIRLNTIGFVGALAVYFVTRNGGGNTVPTYLQFVVGDGTGPNGWICGTVAQNIVKAQGYGTLPGHSGSSCGVAEHI